MDSSIQIQEIYEILYNTDPNWFVEIQILRDCGQPYPCNIYEKICDLLQSNQKLLEKFKYIHENCYSVKEIYDSIFIKISNDEEISTNFDEENEFLDLDSESNNKKEEEIIPVIKEPQQSITTTTFKEIENQKIEWVSNSLNVSNDVSYLLLKKFNFNYDCLMDQWFSNIISKENLPTFLHIPEEMINQSLKAKRIEKGMCNICFSDDSDLYQMYCGHVLCFDCWKNEILYQIEENKTPVVCRIDNCSSEIIIDDICHFCGQETAQNYIQKETKNQIETDRNFVACPFPNCPHYLTCFSVGPSNVAKCECGKRICWKCKKDDHSPLKCDLIQKWEDLQKEMIQLYVSQIEWEVQELKYFKLRLNEIDNIEEIFDKFNSNLLIEHESLNKNEIDEINSLKSKLKETTNEFLIEQIENKIREKEQDNINKQIRRQNEMKENINIQSEYLESIYSGTKSIKKYIKPSYLTQEYFDLFEPKPKNLYIIKEEKKCPKCNVSIFKDGGCNHMTCGNCNHEFCWFCLKAWSNHITCEYDNKTSEEANTEDLKKDKTVLIPFNPFKKDISIDKDTDIIELNDENSKDDINQTEVKFTMPPMDAKKYFLYQRWCQCFDNQQYVLKSILDVKKMIPKKVYDTIMHARSVLINGYSASFFMDVDTIAYKKFQFHLDQLSAEYNSLISISKSMSVDVNVERYKEILIINKTIENLLRAADEINC